MLRRSLLRRRRRRRPRKVAGLSRRRREAMFFLISMLTFGNVLAKFQRLVLGFIKTKLIKPVCEAMGSACGTGKKTDTKYENKGATEEKPVVAVTTRLS